MAGGLVYYRSNSLTILIEIESYAYSLGPGVPGLRFFLEIPVPIFHFPIFHFPSIPWYFSELYLSPNPELEQ